MLALFSCKNNSEMIKSVKNELPYGAERSNSRLINHREINRTLVSRLNVFEREEMGMEQSQ